MADFGAILTSGLFGVVCTLGVQTYASMRAARIDLMNDYIKDLVDIEALAVKYWHETVVLPTDASLRATTAAHLRGKLHAARCFRRVASKFLGDEDFRRFDDLDKMLFRAATGGDFETDRAALDLERADIVMTTCAELRALIRLARRKAYWAR